MRDAGRLRWVPAAVREVGEDDSGEYMIGIRETPAPDSWSLLFMECVDVDNLQEVELGLDTYCLVVDPGQATPYGGVRQCEVDGERLRLTLTEEAAETLRMPVETSLALDVPPHQVERLRRGLGRVLRSGRADTVPELIRL